VAIILMAIVAILLMAIVAILLMVISGYFINDYWLLFYK
jgi:ABC-type transport system involved in cytochrome bd biosynthesis fused ATPase/permease subunit